MKVSVAAHAYPHKTLLKKIKRSGHLQLPVWLPISSGAWFGDLPNLKNILYMTPNNLTDTGVRKHKLLKTHYRLAMNLSYK